MVSLGTILGLLRGLDGFIGKARLAVLKKVTQTGKEMLTACFSRLLWNTICQAHPRVI